MSIDESSKRFYRENAQAYTNHVRNPKDSIYHSYYEKPAMYAELPDIKNKKVLSLGCGSGEDSVYLKKQGADESIGIDITSELIEIAKKSYPECQFKVMDMEQLDFPKDSFDFVYSSLAIHYVEDWGKVFKEVYKVLKPNSYFLFSVGHPVRFAMEGINEGDDSTLRLEIIRNKKADTIQFIGNYLDKRKVAGVLVKTPVSIWKMPFGEISRLIYEAGFLIEKIVDPKPLAELEKIKKATFERLQHVPEFVIFKLFKK